jgi:dTDP-4-dehydrorhamnose reductase
MKILVIGKTGQVGSRLAQLLPAIGETIATGRETVDLAKPDSIRTAVREIRPDVIVNAAGQTNVDRAESEKALVHAVNAVAPGIMAEEAKRLGALLVHYSSVYVFDGAKPDAYTEVDAPRPLNEYGMSKLRGEEAVTSVGCSHIILRASWVYDTRARNFVLTMLRLAAERDRLEVVDDQTGSPTWARSIGEATCGLLRDLGRAKAAPGIYNLAALGAVSRYDFTARIMEGSRRLRPGRALPALEPIKTRDFPLVATRPLNSVLACAKWTETFGGGLSTWQEQLDACLAELGG